MLRQLLLGTRARRRWLAIFVVLCAATLVVALLPATRAPAGLGWDKLDHALAFAVLGAVGLFALDGQRRRVARVLTLLMVLGASIEWLQSYVPSRRADVGDFVADVVGAAVGAGLAWLLARALEERAAREPRHERP